MKKILRKSIPFALSVLAAGAAQVACAAPTSGAYVTDKQNSWVQDRVGDRISTVNMIMCIIGSMRGDAMVNQGPYVALIDQNKCQNRGDSSKSDSTNAGASNAANYTSATVEATQASSDAHLIIKAWLHDEHENGGGSPQKITIFAYVDAAEGKTDAHPNGLFSMYFCGQPVGMSGTCVFKGSLKSDESGLSFYQEETSGGGGGGPSLTKLKLSTSNTDAGYGRVSGQQDSTPYEYLFAYDASNFRRKEVGNPDVCFSRSEAQAETSTWRYGTYQANGDRLDIDHPGFPVKFVGNDGTTTYGYWSFWGLWLPGSAMTALSQGQGTLSRQTNGGDVTLTPTSRGGKLWRLTRHTSSLGELKNVSMMYWSHSSIGTTDGTTAAPTDTNYQVQWDGTSLNAVAYQQCDSNGCNPHPLAAPVTLHASELSSAFIRAMPVFFPDAGGNGFINVPTEADFTADTVVSYRTRDVVDPSSADIGLNCVSMCTKTGTNLVDGSGHLASSPFQDTNAWGPTHSHYSYTYHDGMVADGFGNADASTAAKSSMGGYQWGVTSGTMVTDADLSSIRCNLDGTPSTSGAYYCASLMEQLTTVYQWETGPNQWNMFFGANGVTIDAPKSLALNAAATFSSHVPDGSNNIRGSSESQLTKFNGNKVQLQFNGFGDLQGIPGNCVDPNTNLPVQCGQGGQDRWVPAFDIVDGTTISDGSNSYFVKYLEREQRLGKVSCGTVSGSLTLTAASALDLPTVSIMDVDPTSIGNESDHAPSDTKPKVIQGIVQ